MIPHPQNYATIVFDCDGVVLNSNQVKTEAFRDSVQSYGTPAADALVQYHMNNGGVSRYRKFEYFLTEIVPDQTGPGLEDLLERYSQGVRYGLENCDIAFDLEQFREQTSESTWMIVSGGDQVELNDIFARRGIAKMFDGGIYGSPEPKESIIARLQIDETLTSPALFLGDSAYDFQVASAAGLDFLFVYGWSDLADWPSFVAKHGVAAISAVGDLLE